jgi:DNA-binding MarR family transcriptional regulator
MTRPTADQLAEELRQVISALRRRVRVEAGDETLSYPLRLMLRRVEDGAATTADLARAEVISPQTAGELVAALEELAYVTRKEDTTDGRRRLVTLTAAGRRAIATHRADRRSWLAQRIAAELDSVEQRELHGALVLLRRLVE